MLHWQTWLIIAVVFTIIEMATPTFFIFWFGVGSVGAAVAAYFDLPFVVQMLIFLGVSLTLAASTRRFARRVLRGGKTIRTGAEGLIGKVGVVMEDMNDPLESGQIRIEGEVWTAVTTEGFTFRKGDRVAVLAIDGVKLVIQPLTTWQSKDSQ